MKGRLKFMNDHRKTGGKRPNRLISEKSPYLLQHAYNPVDWHPWDAKAFDKAKKEDKPVFLSIGYSTCHWCHVMERESFVDPMIAQLLNETFVCIKVDKEERPDIDSVYMKVCQMLTGSGGWPLTIIMTHDKKPFFAATYIPRRTRFGRTGMMELIPRIQSLWESRREELIKSAEKVTDLFMKTEGVHTVKNGELGESILKTTFEELDRQFDECNGGFGVAPKFPSAHNLLFLLRYWKRSGNEKALHMVEKTLKAMRLGGIYDHLGFGFHRYSTDSKWLVPHFEKMLYDQAMLTLAYTEAFQATGRGEYEQTVRETLTYVLRDMTDPQGGFYSAKDADSEGEEGKFYLWTEDEVSRFLSADETNLVRKIFNLEKGGNFEDESTWKRTGRNILYMKKSLDENASKLGISSGMLQEKFDIARQKLYDERVKRVAPSKDDKILTDWNGLMIAALAKAARVFDETEYRDASKKAVDFVLNKLLDSKGRLLHRYRDGEVAIPGFLDDYAFFIWGLLELYETTFEVEYLVSALKLSEELAKHFWDEEDGGFFFSGDDAEEILVRKKEIHDGAIPSGNSVAFLNLIRLARMTANTDLEDRASEMLSSFSGIVSKSPVAYTYLMTGVDFVLGVSYEVVIVGNYLSEDTKSLIRTLRNKFIPNKVVLLRECNEMLPKISHLAAFTRDLHTLEGKATAYICKNYKCNLPTTDKQKMLDLLNMK
jgi:uncharacterized protein YyaL (SSP411 family)